MKKQIKIGILHLLFIVSLVAVLTMGMAPISGTRAQTGTTSTSDLRVRITSMPKRVKACQTFKVTFSIKNLGPDPASRLYMIAMLPDPFGLVELRGAPESLKVGQTVTFSAFIKVVAFVPGEPREAWVGMNTMSDPYPNISIDPNPDNNYVSRQIRLASEPVLSCP